MDAACAGAALTAALQQRDEALRRLGRAAAAALAPRVWPGLAKRVSLGAAQGLEPGGAAQSLAQVAARADARGVDAADSADWQGHIMHHRPCPLQAEAGAGAPARHLGASGVDG
jgi:hypothetical protein